MTEILILSKRRFYFVIMLRMHFVDPAQSIREQTNSSLAMSIQSKLETLNFFPLLTNAVPCFFSVFCCAASSLNNWSA